MWLHFGARLMSRNFVIFADGGSRGNPGPAGFGCVVLEDNKVVGLIRLHDIIALGLN